MFLIRRFLCETAGATAIEYCMIAGIISIAIVVGVTGIGSSLNNVFYGPLNTALR